jgi:hypothetical protein
MATGRAGEYVYPDITAFQNSVGFFRRIMGAPPRQKIALRRVSVVGQDAWRPNPSIELVAGARVASFRIPDSTDITLDPRWAALSGLSNRGTKAKRVDFEPRILITLNPGGRQDWELRGGALLDSDFADPGFFAEWSGNTGGLTVRTALGQLDPWGSAQIDATVDRGATLSVIGPDFRGPRTTRAFATITRTLANVGTLRAGVTIRRTDYLPRRTDLNRQRVPRNQDQFGRPVWGQLEKRGAMLAAVPDSGRRFAGYEHVWGVDATSQSRYTGISISAERALPGPFAFFAGYTWSKTEDDWLMGTPGDPFTQLNPFPDSTGVRDWQDGRSDLDVPHRFTAGGELRFGDGIHGNLGVLFRYQSGYPFTPGFRPGVDANADGSTSNDPAFIDDAVSGMSGLLAAWPCLQQDEGQFVRRNACRGPGLRSLDARLALSLRQNTRYSATLVIDALDLISSRDGVVDRAVYLVDAAGTLQTSADGETITLPLLANSNFGQLLTRYSPQRQVRLGLRLSF